MKSPLLTALVHPLNVMMVGVTIFAGLLSAWWLFPIGLVLWAIMVITVSRDRALRFNAAMQRREPLAQRFQHYFDRIERTQVGIFNALSAATPRTRRLLEPIRVEVNRLADEAYTLCLRMTSLENYRVVSQSRADLAGDLGRVAQAIEQTTDPGLLEHYTTSQRALEERLTKLDRVAKLLDRVEAQLMSLVSEMDGVVTEVLHLQAAAQEISTPLVSDIVMRLRQQTERLYASEEQALSL